MKKVVVTRALRSELVKLFSVHPDTVKGALNFKTNTDLSRKIRSLAIQKGGVLIGGENEMETIFKSNGDMIQSWGGKAQIIAKKSGLVKIIIDGEVDREVKDMSVNELMKEQNRISTLIASH